MDKMKQTDSGKNGLENKQKSHLYSNRIHSDYESLKLLQVQNIKLCFTKL